MKRTQGASSPPHKVHDTSVLPEGRGTRKAKTNNNHGAQEQRVQNKWEGEPRGWHAYIQHINTRRRTRSTTRGATRQKRQARHQTANTHEPGTPHNRRSGTVPGQSEGPAAAPRPALIGQLRAQNRQHRHQPTLRQYASVTRQAMKGNSKVPGSRQERSISASDASPRKERPTGTPGRAPGQATACLTRLSTTCPGLVASPVKV